MPLLIIFLVVGAYWLIGYFIECIVTGDVPSGDDTLVLFIWPLYVISMIIVGIIKVVGGFGIWIHETFVKK